MLYYYGKDHQGYEMVKWESRKAGERAGTKAEWKEIKKITNEKFKIIFFARIITCYKDSKLSG